MSCELRTVDHTTPAKRDQPIDLDQSQMDSLIAGLGQSVSLIQGPPGKVHQLRALSTTNVDITRNGQVFYWCFDRKSFIQAHERDYSCSKLYQSCTGPVS